MSDAKTENSIGWKHADMAQQILDLRELIGDNDLELLSDTYEGETGFFELIDDILKIIDSDAAIVTGLTELISNNNERKIRKSKRIDRLRVYLEMMISRSGLKTIERPAATLTIRQLPQTLIIEDEEKIPSKYWAQQPPKLDKKSMNKEMKQGTKIPGTTLSNGGQSITIRRT